MLYTRDPYTGDHLVIDGDEVIRLQTRAEALEIANRRCAAVRASMRVAALEGDAENHVTLTLYDPERVAHIHRELHQHLPAESALRVKALESLLVEKEQVARELRGAGVPLSFMRRYSEKART